jgi:hypothetical protein
MGEGTLNVAKLYAGALAFGEVLAAGFERGFFEIGIPFPPGDFRTVSELGA